MNAGLISPPRLAIFTIPFPEMEPVDNLIHVHLIQSWVFSCQLQEKLSVAWSSCFSFSRGSGAKGTKGTRKFFDVPFPPFFFQFATKKHSGDSEHSGDSIMSELDAQLTAEAAAAEHAATDPAVAEPVVAEPAVAEPAVAEPAVAEPAVTEPAVAEPAAAEPAVAEPAAAEPAVAEPAVAEPAAAEPAVAADLTTAAEPAAAEPAAPEPAVSEPAASEPAVVTEPTVAAEPAAAEPILEAEAGTESATEPAADQSGEESDGLVLTQITSSLFNHFLFMARLQLFCFQFALEFCPKITSTRKNSSWTTKFGDHPPPKMDFAHKLTFYLTQGHQGNSCKALQNRTWKHYITTARFVCTPLHTPPVCFWNESKNNII